VFQNVGVLFSGMEAHFVGRHLELVRSEHDAPLERIVVCEIGDIEAPETVDEAGLAHRDAPRWFGDGQKTHSSSNAAAR
jgi:hypothetical protein